MKTVGIICEYNPFHLGHVYHINQIKKMYPESIIVLVLSGNFTQRGDASLIDKWKKTEIALNYVDLVIELPFVFACQSADLFALGACDILKHLNVDVLVFGSESDDVKRLYDFSIIQDSSEYNLKVKEYLDLGYNYPTSLSNALEDICGDSVRSSNDLLALSYIKNLKNSNIKCVSIKRTNDYLNSEITGEITSGTSIREALKKGKDVSKYVPDVCLKYLKNLHFIDDYFDLLKYKIISEDISKYQTVDEGIHNRIKKVINEVNSFDDLLDKVKSKRYTYNKIRRMMLHILVGFTKKEAKELSKTEYIRVLGFNDNGRKYLKKVKNECEIPILLNYKKGFEGLDLESRVSMIYNLINKDDDLLEHEHKVIIKWLH